MIRHKKITEATLHQQVVNYLRAQYPKIIFRTDFAAGCKMTIGQAVKHKKLQYSRAFPDLFIAAARKGRYGLFIELKRDGEKLYKRDGGFKDEHIKEQAAMLHRLYVSGYETFFAIGFEQAKKFIDDYLMT